MGPLHHILVTILAFAAVYLVFPLDISVLMYALAFTIGIDVVDHGVSFFTVNKRMRSEVMPLIRRKRIGEAYRVYKEKRFKYNSMLLHTNLFFVIWIVVSIYFQSVAVFIGLVLHYAADILDARWHWRAWRGSYFNKAYQV